MKCDLVVIGAGPAGSMAARSAASKGLDVVLLEKRQEIGEPVRCGEGVSRAGLKRLIRPDPTWIACEVRGARVHAPDGSSISLFQDQIEDEVGYILERKIFDRALAAEAAAEGAEVMVKTRAISLLMNGGSVQGVSAMSSGKELKIEAPLVIGADGVESKVGRWAGIYQALKPQDLVTCVQFLIRDERIDQDYVEFYFGSALAPGGYIWSIPKGDNLANFGICLLGSKSRSGLGISLLQSFLNLNLPNAGILDMVTGGIPICGPPKSLTANGVMLVGDAARQADPFSCGGILNGMLAGALAGVVAAEAISLEDVSKNGLMDYERRWRSALGKRMMISRSLRAVYNHISDEDLNDIIRVLQGQDTSKVDLGGLAKTLFQLKPGLLLKISAYGCRFD